ncbi:GNAT family N-acetyltransferase [Aquimarina sp. AU474]|uniref:GNAT family N-acetyltransferase n=1 Tax=Aquimarina sp. AU474 TaxID=2108529 RepID=UPI000D689F19|nr:GNAT family N-acetyltransferase [Aquimarina sp. AU474]
MSSTISFLPCTPSNISDLVKISQQFYPEHYIHIWKNNDPSYYVNLSFSQKAFEDDLKIDNIAYFLIQKADEKLGLLKIRKHQAIEGHSEFDALQLEKIYLLKNSIGMGVGKKGVEFVKNYANTLDKKIIWLDVMTTSPALHFYKKMNFKTISYYELDYPGLKDGYREMQRMTLPL